MLYKRATPDTLQKKNLAKAFLEVASHKFHWTSPPNPAQVRLGNLL